MSIKIMTLVFDRYPEGGGEMILALSLADHASDDGKNIFPSVLRLAKKTRQSERTVQRQLRKMEMSGWLIKIKNGGGGRGKTAEYHISREWIKGDNLSSIDKKGDIDNVNRVTSEKNKSDTAKSPNSSLESSFNPSSSSERDDEVINVDLIEYQNEINDEIEAAVAELGSKAKFPGSYKQHIREKLKAGDKKTIENIESIITKNRQQLELEMLGGNLFDFYELINK